MENQEASIAEKLKANLGNVGINKKRTTALNVVDQINEDGHVIKESNHTYDKVKTNTHIYDKTQPECCVYF